MKLSVILPCYNGGATIAVQLDALASQTYSGEWELIVVNNGSTDNSMESVQAYHDRIPNLRIVDAYEPPGPRRPVYHSYNVGTKAATGDAFLFCEADDEVCHEWLDSMAKSLQDYQFIVGAMRYDRLNPKWLVITEEQWPQEHELVDMDNPVGLGFAYGCNLAIMRSVYKSVNGLDETLPFAADKDFCWRVQQTGVELHFNSNAIVQYRLRHLPGAAFRQAKNWGKDHPLLYARYQIPLEYPVVLHRLIQLLLYMPNGIKLFLMKILNIGRSKGGWVRWVWGLGFRIGEIQGFLEHKQLKYAYKGSVKRLQPAADSKGF